MESTDDIERREAAESTAAVAAETMGNDIDGADVTSSTEPRPNAFVKWALFPALLEQANTDGVNCTL